MGIGRGPADQFHAKNVANYSLPKPKAVSRSTSSWFTDPETKRRKRVAQYKLVSMEGKAKQIVQNSCRWLKAKYIAEIKLHVKEISDHSKNKSNKSEEHKVLGPEV